MKFKDISSENIVHLHLWPSGHILWLPARSCSLIEFSHLHLL